MTTTVFTLLPNKANKLTQFCDGSEESSTEDYLASSTCHTKSSWHHRPSTKVAGWDGTPGGMRYFTPYEVYGLKVEGYVNGVTRYKSDRVCTSESGYQHIRNDYAVWISSLGLGNITDLSGHSAEISEGLLSDAYSEAIEPIFDLCTNLGELPQALNLLMNIRKRVYSLIPELASLAIKRFGLKTMLWYSRPGNERTLFGILSAIWLEFRYGIRPLLGMMEDLGELAGSLVVGPKDFVYKTGKRKNVQARTRTFNPSQSYFLTPNFRQALNAELAVWEIHRACVTVSVTPHERNIGSNWMSTAWELFPLSFVFDWILNMDRYLRTLWSQDVPLKMTSCTSYEVRTDFNVTGTSGYDSESYEMITPINVYGSEYSYTRTPHIGRIPPKLYYRKPDFGGDLKYRLVDLGTLVRQIIF